MDVAAAAYVLRPAGWVKLVAAAGEEAQRAPGRAGRRGGRSASWQRLREELAEARAAARSETERLPRASWRRPARRPTRTQRKLRSAPERCEARRGGAAQAAEPRLEAVRGAAAAAQVSAAESETRRLQGPARRGRGGAGGRPPGGARGPQRRGHAAAAAAGHRAGRGPGAAPRAGAAARRDAVPRTRSTRSSRAGCRPKDIAARALSETDPALLDQLLALPQAHLVVDGYNVTKTGYPTMPLEKQRLRLLGGLAVLAAQTGAEITCVFDGAELAAPVLLAPPRGVRVLFSKPGVTADELIRQLVRAEPPGRPVVVVSTDREVADGVAAAGARPVRVRLAAEAAFARLSNCLWPLRRSSSSPPMTSTTERQVELTLLSAVLM